MDKTLTINLVPHNVQKMKRYILSTAINLGVNLFFEVDSKKILQDQTRCFTMWRDNLVSLTIRIDKDCEFPQLHTIAPCCLEDSHVVKFVLYCFQVVFAEANPVQCIWEKTHQTGRQSYDILTSQMLGNFTVFFSPSFSCSMKRQMDRISLVKMSYQSQILSMQTHDINKENAVYNLDLMNQIQIRQSNLDVVPFFQHSLGFVLHLELVVKYARLLSACSLFYRDKWALLCFCC